MNSKEELLERTLDAFPHELLKHHFNVEGKKNDTIQKITEQNSDKIIKKFFCDFFNYLHLNISVFELNSNIPQSIKKLMNGECIRFKNTNKYKEWIYLHKTAIDFYDTEERKSNSIEFLIPVKIINRKKKLIIYQNIFKRDINSYFEQPIFQEKRKSVELGVIDNIKHHYDKSMFILDLNKGVKYLWEKDFIDAKVVKHRESKSIRQDRMDEDYLYKASYPEEWKELMKSPIQKTKFKSLTSDISLDHFDCNPSTGFVGVSFHPNSEDDIIDLINLIIKHN
ncbi:hypothetical protein LDL76_05405 [Salegentibacter mishustinae]|uniref:hypothetical protein n=1 Tax=Salegentibacter mishustinae TaxID=270918 RepID=UPI001CE08A94|nr:hypothetical protein [Salegentibacter mishustinae]UBZ08146.1 hypothetical protein LDL76_05405 [Salegentibacter mishustinae]